MHCFTGTKEFAENLLTLNVFFSASGIITFKNTIEIQEVAKYTPMDRVLIETDSPYLSPDPLRGKKNYPHNVILVAKKLSELKKIEISEIGMSTSANFLKVFNI